VPAPLGNQNEAKGKRWAGAIRRALHEYEDETIKQGEALLAIARKVVKAALDGDPYARKEIGERLDGKPAQAVTVSGDEDNPLRTSQTVTFVHASPEEAKKLNGHSAAGEVRKTVGTG
jgi:hypothetical protein